MIQLNNIKIGDGNPFVLFAGPCVVENEKTTISTAEEIKKITDEIGIPFVFKSSLRKANRTNINSFVGLGDDVALSIMEKVKADLDIQLLTDVHSPEDVSFVKNNIDILQIPAFLCRQTDLLVAAGQSGLVVNIKKGQFLAPGDMAHAAEKVASTGNEKILLTERGTTFGYGNLVVDMRGLVIMRDLGYPVVMDATHSVQMPGMGNVTGGNPKFIKPLAKAAAAVGLDALFLEVHPDPSNAKSDAASQLPLKELKQLLLEIKGIDDLVKQI